LASASLEPPPGIRNGDGPTDGDACVAIPVALARAGVDGADASSRVVTARVVVVVADMVARDAVCRTH
jgi:hypothetical protein